MTRADYAQKPTHILVADGSVLRIDYSGAQREIHPPRYHTSLGTFVVVPTVDIRKAQGVSESETPLGAPHYVAELEREQPGAPVFGLLVRRA